MAFRLIFLVILGCGLSACSNSEASNRSTTDDDHVDAAKHGDDDVPDAAPDTSVPVVVPGVDADVIQKPGVDDPATSASEPSVTSSPTANVPDASPSSVPVDAGPRVSVADSGDASPSMSEEVSATEACIDYLVTPCMRLAECSANADAVESCVPLAEQCPDRLFGPGMTQTPDELVACAAQWEMMSCEALEAGERPDCGLEPGTLELHEECLFKEQCASGMCRSPTRLCGICSQFAGEGDDCRLPQFFCPDESFCDAADGRCVDEQPPEVDGVNPELIGRAIGEPCDVDYDCVQAAYCYHSSAGGECRGSPRPGEDCSQNDRCASATFGEMTRMYCDASTLLCTEAPVRGEPCALEAAGNAQCEVGSSCRFDPPYDGVCGPHPEVGEPCTFGAISNLQVVFCAEGAACDVNADPPTCRVAEAGEPNWKEPWQDAEPAGPGEVCYARSGCEPPYACLCVGPGCQWRACGERVLPGEPCDEPHLLCHPGSECDSGICRPVQTRWVFEDRCGP